MKINEQSLGLSVDCLLPLFSRAVAVFQRREALSWYKWCKAPFISVNCNYYSVLTATNCTSRREGCVCAFFPPGFQGDMEVGLRLWSIELVAA